MGALFERLAGVQAGVAVAVLVGLLLAETLAPFYAHFRDRAGRGRHGLKNLVLGSLNAVVVALGFAALWVAAATWASDRGIGLLNVLRDGAGMPAWMHVVLAVLLLDVWMYAWHRMNHRVPFLWRFHRVHHADAHMDVTTASRFHVGELVLSSLLRVPVLVVLGVYAWELVLYETIAFVVVQVHHANIALPAAADRWLRRVVVTPAMHRVHHSRWQPETDSNYGSLLSVWDRLFRSFRLRERPEEIELGLDEFDAPEHGTLKGLLKMPLAEPHKSPDEG